MTITQLIKNFVALLLHYLPSTCTCTSFNIIEEYDVSELLTKEKVCLWLGYNRICNLIVIYINTLHI